MLSAQQLCDSKDLQLAVHHLLQPRVVDFARSFDIPAGSIDHLPQLKPEGFAKVDCAPRLNLVGEQVPYPDSKRGVEYSVAVPQVDIDLSARDVV